MVSLVPLLFALSLEANPATLTTSAPSGGTTGAGVVLLSRRRWLAQESRLVASLHIYIRDLNLTIETHLLPHEATSAEEQARFAQESCEPEVAMVFWFGQDDTGPVLTTLRCTPRETRVLPLPAGAAERHDLDVLAHGLALRLRSMLVLGPRAPGTDARPVARAEAKATGSDVASVVSSREVGRASPREPPSPLAADAPRSAGPALSRNTDDDRPPPPASTPGEERAPAREQPDVSIAANPAAAPSPEAEEANAGGGTATLLGARALGSLATGERARGLGGGLFLAHQGRTQTAELGVGAARLADQSGPETVTPPATPATSGASDFSWWILTLHAAWAARTVSRAWSFEGGPVVGATRFAITGHGAGGRLGSAAAWSLEVGLRGLVRWQFSRHFAAEATLSVALDVPRQRFTFDGIPQADSGTVRAASGLGLAYLF